MRQKLTTEEFIYRVKEKHGDYCDYSKVDYKDAKTKVCIICPEHGEFWQMPHKHLTSKYPCPKCGYKKNGEAHLKTTDEFIKEAKSVHGDKYDYSNTVYYGALKKVVINCKKHGDFHQLAINHLRGCECPKCVTEDLSINCTLTKEKFIEKTKEIHGDKYDYSKVEYINSHIKVCIICPEHGEFWQTANSHLNGCGCPKCGIKSASEIKKISQEIAIKRLQDVHGNKYDYTITNYNGYEKQIEVRCLKHGVFKTSYASHIQGCGCPKCAVERQHDKFVSTREEFIEKAKSVHGDKYDYSNVTYYNSGTKVCIICSEHGEFWQTPNSHLNGCGCPKCAIENMAKSNTMSFNEFIEKAKSVHGDKYDYSKVKYINAKSKVCIICPKHGEFEQEANAHLSGCGCPKCVNQTSSCEKEIINYFKNICQINIIERDKKIIKPYEIDIYIPSLKLGIEYNGLYWHSEEQGKDKNYHLKKLELCKKENVKLIQIFEDEYVNHKEIVYNKINHIIGFSKDLQKIPGRKCIIDVIDKTIAEEFLEKYHIQGFGAGTIHLGAYYNCQLISVMSFKQEIKGGTHWELTRFASDYHYICQGVGGKLFKYFVNNYNPEEIKSFADRRWTVDEENNVYLQLGFKFDKYTPPDYTYFKSSDGLIRQHKFGFRKQKLNKKYGLPLTMTETEMMKQLGYRRIWNCGLIKYIWRDKNATS